MRTACIAPMEMAANLRCLCVCGFCLPAKWQNRNYILKRKAENVLWSLPTGTCSFLLSFFLTQFFSVAMFSAKILADWKD
jgi:hypothetical protein